MKIAYTGTVLRTYTARSGRSYYLVQPETATRSDESRMVPTTLPGAEDIAPGTKIAVQCEYLDYYSRRDGARHVYVIPDAVKKI